MIKIRLLAVAAAIILVLSGCGGGRFTGSGSSAMDIPASTGYEHVKIEWYWNTGNIKLPEDGYICRKIKEELNITYVHSAPQGSDYYDRLDVLLASQDIPDLISCDPVLTSKLVANGLAVPVENYLNENHIPNLIRTQKNWELAVNLLESDDGHIYAVPSTNNNSLSAINMYIRYDWLKNLNLKVPEDLDELREVLAKFTFGDPDRNGKDDTCGTYVPEFWGSTPYQAIMAADRSTWYRSGDGSGITLGMFLPRHKDFLKFMKSLCDTGAMDKDTLTTKKKKADEMIAAGKSGFELGYGDYESNAEIRKRQPDADWRPMPPVRGAYDRGYLPDQPVLKEEIVVTTACENVNAAFRLFNYMADDRSTGERLDFSGTYWICRFGEKGVNWDVKPDGSFETGQSDETIRIRNQAERWPSLCARFKSKFDNAYVSSLPPGHRKAYDDLVSYPTFADIPGSDPKKPVNMEGIAIPGDVSGFKLHMDKKWEELYSKCILGNADIDDTWAEFAAEAEKAGLREIQSEMTALAEKYGRFKR